MENADQRDAYSLAKIFFIVNLRTVSHLTENPLWNVKVKRKIAFKERNEHVFLQILAIDG